MSFIAQMFGGGGDDGGGGPDPAAQAAAQKAAQEAAQEAAALATQQEGYRRKQAYGVAVQNTKDTLAGTNAGVGTSSGLLSYNISEQQKPTTLGG